MASDLSAARAEARAAVERSRAELRGLAARGEVALRAAQVTDKWDAVDMLRHILVWNDHALAALDTWGAPADRSQFGDDFNGYNEAAVAARSGLDGAAVVAQLEAAYARYDALLASASDAELDAPGEAPWGQPLTRLGLIGVVDHDLEHYDHIRAALAG